MKGAELPINTIVIIVLVLLVLIGILAFFLGVWNPASGGVSLEGAKSAACQRLVSRGCETSWQEILVEKYDANNDGYMVTGSTWDGTCGTTATSEDNLASLCGCRYLITDESQCKSLCGCGGAGGSSGGSPPPPPGP